MIDEKAPLRISYVTTLNLQDLHILPFRILNQLFNTEFFERII